MVTQFAGRGDQRVVYPIMVMTVVQAPRLMAVDHGGQGLDIDGNSYRLRQHASLMPDNLITPIAGGQPARRRRGRPRKGEKAGSS